MTDLEKARKGKTRSIKRLLYGFGAVTGFFLFNHYYNTEIDLVLQDSKRNNYLVKKTAALTQPYISTFYLPFRFMEIIYCARFEPLPFMKLKEERIYTKQGDLLELDWGEVPADSDENDPEGLRIALVLGPVNGANNCKYSRHIMEQLQRSGFRTVFSHYKNFKLYEDNHDGKPKVDQYYEEKVIHGLHDC